MLYRPLDVNARRPAMELPCGDISLEQIADRLDSIALYSTRAEFEVYLPSAADPVHYDVDLMSYMPQVLDTLAPCDYLINWKLFAPGHFGSGQPSSTGFSAYYDGNHYRMRDGDTRLQEYHIGWDKSPFSPPGRGVEDGVQCNAQFTELLPQFMARQFRNMASDSLYEVQIYSEQHAVVVKGVQRAGGYDVREFEYVLDPVERYRPVAMEVVTSPGAISEQTISVKYSYTSDNDIDNLIPLDEKKLISIYPSVFAGMRESNFRIENLRGQPLCGFSLPTLTGERYTYDQSRDERRETRADGRPKVVVFLDPGVGDTKATVRDVREAVGQLPFGTDVLWVFVSGTPDEAEAVVGYSQGQGEYVLMRGRSIARDCGVSDTPSILFVGRDGIVKEVQVGENKDMPSIVIQKTIICN